MDMMADNQTVDHQRNELVKENDGQLPNADQASTLTPSDEPIGPFIDKCWPPSFDRLDIDDIAAIKAWFADPKHSDFTPWLSLKGVQPTEFYSLDAIVLVLTQQKFRMLLKLGREAITPYMEHIQNVKQSGGKATKTIRMADRARNLSKLTAAFLLSVCEPFVQAHCPSSWMVKFCDIYHRRIKASWQTICLNHAKSKGMQGLQSIRLKQAALGPHGTSNPANCAPPIEQEEEEQIISDIISRKRPAVPESLPYQGNHLTNTPTPHSAKRPKATEDTIICDDGIKVESSTKPCLPAPKGPRPSWARTKSLIVLPPPPARAPSPTLQTLNRCSVQQSSAQMSQHKLSTAQILNILVEESEGHMPSDNPISEEELRVDNLSEFFARVIRRRTNPTEKIPRLKFSQRWGAKVAFVIDASDSEELWRKMKGDMRRNFSLQSEKKPGKREFEIWVTCEGLEASSEDEDEW